jgi:hypothetical protein
MLTPPNAVRPRHILYCTHSCSAGSIVREWFAHSARLATSQVVVPIPSEVPDINTDDVVWFVLDDVLLGHARVTQVERGPSRAVCWLTSGQAHPKKKRFHRGRKSKYLTQRQGERWLEECFGKLPSSVPRPSLIEPIPSPGDLRVLQAIREQQENLRLTVVTLNGQQRTALVLLQPGKGGTMNVHICAFLFCIGDKLVDDAGRSIEVKQDATVASSSNTQVN